MPPQKQPNSRSDVLDIAERLFVAHWKPASGTTTKALAAMCFQSAQEFHRVAGQIAEGRTPDDVLNNA